MSNPLFNQLSGGNQNIIAQYRQFRQQFANINPREEVMKAVSSGRISQADLNRMQSMANQLQGILK